MLDGSGVKAMPGLIPTPNSGSLKNNKKIQVAKWEAPKNNLKKNVISANRQNSCIVGQAHVSNL